MNAGMLAAFVSPEAMLRAVTELRKRGYTELDGFTPFAVPGAEEAFGLSRSRLPRVVGVCAFTGALGAYLLQTWTVAWDYPLNVGGRPPYAPPVFVPITFEMGVLFAAFSALVAAIVLAGLPRLWDPVFEVVGFESATIDQFWVAIGESDPLLDRPVTAELLSDLGAARIVNMPEEAR